MQGKYIKLGILVVLTAIFALSYRYYGAKETRTQDAIAVMEYKVLDKQMWSMEEEAKNHALSKDSSYDEISVLKKQHKDAAKKKKIGYWLMVLFGIGTTGYLLYALYLYAAVALAERKKRHTPERKL